MVLIVGGDSAIGTALSKYWENRKILFHSSTRHKELQSDSRPVYDLANTRTFKKLLDYDSAVFCAAITDMFACEYEPEKTRAVNVSGTIDLIKKLSINKTHILLLSSNQVFDGKYPFQHCYTPRNPINEYGKQKAEVEEFIENIPNSCILRLTKVIHPDLPLLQNWKNFLAAGKNIYAFTDMTLSPIHINDVLTKIDNLVRKQKNGICQLSGDRDISYFEYALDFADKNGYSRDLVKKDTWEGKLDFKPPKYTSMLNAK